MKIFISIILMSVGLTTAPVFALQAKSIEIKSPNIAFVTALYKEVYVKKDFDQLEKYLSQDVKFYKNLTQPLNFQELKKHLIEQGEECVKINMLPFDDIMASGSKVVTLYTRSCTDKFNNIHKRRVMAITEINSKHKISNIWVVAHEQIGSGIK